MTERRRLPAITVAVVLLAPGLAVAEQTSPTAAVPPVRSVQTTARINDLGPENGAMARAVGVWDVTETVWDAPNAVPVVAKSLVAERRMIGSVLQETLRSATDPAKTLRIDDLTFNRVESRWEYVSMDTRAAVGMMTAQSYGRGEPGKIAIMFQPFSIPGPGPNVSGQMLRMRQEIIAQTRDRDVKDQFFTMADGIGVEWLAHRYAYVRRK